jgi:opine dehydrogenase
VSGVCIAQLSDLLYASSRAPGATVTVTGKKKKAALGVFPSCDRDKVLGLLEFFPEYEPAINVLEAGMRGPGMLLHPLPMLMNAVRIDREGAYIYDSYDITPTVARVIERLDEERMALVAALGGNPVPIKYILNAFYGATGTDFYETVVNVAAYRRTTSPPNFEHRYITEEIPTHMVPAIEIGRQLGIHTPMLQATVTFASAVSGVDYKLTGWTAERLGIAGMNRSVLLKFLENG